MKLFSLISQVVLAQESWDIPPPNLEITSEERVLLEAGQVVYRSDLAREGSSGLSMVLVNTPAKDVWEVVLDFDSYVLFLPYVTASWSELREPLHAGVTRLRWGMELTTKGVVTRYAVEGRLHSPGGYMTWEMVPVGSSPMSRATGYWMSSAWDDGRTLLIYSVDVETAWWLPISVHRKAADRGLPATVALFGRRAEKQRARARK